jgi:hypothetical protein
MPFLKNIYFYTGLSIRKTGPKIVKLTKKLPGNAGGLLDPNLLVEATNIAELSSSIALSLLLDKATNDRDTLILGLSLLSRYYNDPRFKETLNLVDEIFNYHECGSLYAGIIVFIDI